MTSSPVSYPDDETLARSESFAELGVEATQVMNDLWLSVKTSTSNTTLYLILTIAAIAAVILFFVISGIVRAPQKSTPLPQVEAGIKIILASSVAAGHFCCKLFFTALSAARHRRRRFRGDGAELIAAGEEAVGVTVAADGAEDQRVPAAALRKRKAQIAADAVEADLIRGCGAADARFPGNGLTVNIAAVRRKRSQGDISADSTEVIVLSQKPRTR